MKKAIAEKWVKALRSKKYKQAKSILKIKNKAGVVRHCCLGVLCELYQKDQRAKNKKLISVSPECAYQYDHDFPKTSTIFDFDGDATHLPDKVKNWAGMRSNCGDLNGEMVEVRGHGCYDLVTVNDNGGNFRTIANLIEARVKDL